MQRKSEFLKFKASQQAAAAFLLAINLSRSKLASKFGLVSLDEIHCGLNDIDYEMQSPTEFKQNNPLSLWSDQVAELSGISVEQDIKPVYKVLLKYVNELFFKGQLVADSSLWFNDDFCLVTGQQVATKDQESPKQEDVKMSDEHISSPASTCNSTPVQNEVQ